MVVPKVAPLSGAGKFFLARAGVVKNVADNAVVAGKPARLLKNGE